MFIVGSYCAGRAALSVPDSHGGIALFDDVEVVLQSAHLVQTSDSKAVGDLVHLRETLSPLYLTSFRDDSSYHTHRGLEQYAGWLTRVFVDDDLATRRDTRVRGNFRKI